MSDSTPPPPPPPMMGYPMVQDSNSSTDAANAPKYVGFVEAVSRAFRQYAKFSGRATRSEYWWFVVFLFTCQFPYLLLIGMAQSESAVMSQIGGLLLALVPFVLFIPSLALLSRRIHDTGRSATLYFSLLAILIVATPFLYLLLIIGAFISYDGEGSGLLFVAAVPIVAFGIYQLVLTVGPSTPEANKYGPGPQ